MRKIPETSFSDLDEHNNPTEPMSAINLSPHSAPTYTIGAGNGNAGFHHQGIPAPLPPELPFPQNGQPVGPYQSLPETPGVYPVLPPLPVVKGNGRPPGGAALSGDRARSRSSYPRRSSFPTFIGVLFL